MEILPIVRLVWRRRIVLGLGVVLALGIGLLLARGDETRAGSATGRVVIDTPVSQLVDTAPKGADSLVWRAELLAHLMTSRQTRLQIARQAGIAPQELSVVSASLNNPVLPTTLPRRAAAVAVRGTEPYVLIVLADGALPIISLDGQAPTAAAAARLVAAGVATLRSRAISPAGGGAATQPLDIQGAGGIRASEARTNGRLKRAFAASTVAFCLWCVLVLLGPAAVTSARRAIRPARFTA